MNKFEKEYETLRHELNENKKYIFERPLVIITAAFVLFGYASDSDFIMLFPPVIIYLLLFNLKFTSNRLDSSARIVAYIRLFIEERNKESFQWESFLSKYREPNEGEEKGLRYYPTIYWFHIISALLFLFLEVLLYFENPVKFNEIWSFSSMITSISVTLCLIGLVFIFIIGISNRPEKAKEYFKKENQRVKEIITQMKPDN
jgi:uncharacterized membrane protein